MSEPHITITYCTQCNWLLRASWMASELLSTFGTDLGSVTLVPGTGGIFRIDVDGTVTELPCVERPPLPGTVEELTATTADGTAVHSWLVLPAGDAPAPLLLWVHHFETMPPADLHESVSTDEPARLLRDATEKGVATTDTLEEWAA